MCYLLVLDLLKILDGLPAKEVWSKIFNNLEAE